MLSFVLLAILLVLVLGALPSWPHSRGWGYMPAGSLGTVVIVVLLLIALGRI